MNLHEYQARQLLAARGVIIPSGQACDTPEDAEVVARNLFNAGASRVAIKSQIHAGGRGKGTFQNGFKGGVHLCTTSREVQEKAQAMLGQVLVTKQTGPQGRLVRKLLVVEAPEILRELYLAVLLDRARGVPVMLASQAGGMDIEEVAAKTPEKLFKEWVDPAFGLMGYQARNLAVKLGLQGELFSAATALLLGVYKTWWDCDASLVEINPLCVVRKAHTKEAVYAVDAKVTLDDNALYRHPDLHALRDLGEEAPLEVEASKHNLNYIKLDGNIACLVNGAGLAMATMDIIKHYGGNPANFLDVGGGASREQVTAAFKIILSDAAVKGILVNIFGGIMQCDIIAAGIVSAVKDTGLKLPLVVRLEGNNSALGKQIIRDSGLNVVSADSMADAAQKIVQQVGT